MKSMPLDIMAVFYPFQVILGIWPKVAFFMIKWAGIYVWF
jgi:hypothetical protein